MDIEKILKELSQDFILEKLSKEDKQKLIDQILKFDLTKLKHQRDSFLDQSQKTFPKIESFGNLFPLKECTHHSEDFIAIGDESLKNNEVAVIFLAGGMGTRLKWDHPKGTYPVTTVKKKSLFQIFSEKILAAQKKYRARFKVAFMVSNENYDESILFFEKHNFFNLKEQIYFFKQDDLPFLNEDGSWVFTDKIFYGPDGNGDLFKYFKRANLLEKFKKDNIKYVTVLSIDNPLADPLDPILVGFHKKCGSDLSLIAIEKENLSMGALFQRKDGLKIIEYMDMTKELWEKTRFLNVGTYCFNLQFIERDFELPYHHVKKKVKEKTYIKSEKFLFDLFDYCTAKAICYPKKLCYAPLKNYCGINSLEDVQRALLEKDKYILKKFFNVDLNAQEISFDYHYPTNELLETYKEKILKSGYLDS